MTNIFRLLFLSAILIFAGCKGDGKKTQEVEEVVKPEIEQEDLQAEQEQIKNTVIAEGGAVIMLMITDAKTLFESDESSIIDEKNPSLEYINMESEGQKPEHRAATNDEVSAKKFESSVYRGRNTVWHFRVDPTNPDNRKFIIEVQEIDFQEDPVNPCQAFDLVRYPRGNKGLVRAQVKGNAPVGCQQPYTIIFTLHDITRDTSRTFVLDPWIIVR